MEKKKDPLVSKKLKGLEKGSLEKGSHLQNSFFQSPFQNATINQQAL
jgi:hypothetical protein